MIATLAKIMLVSHLCTSSAGFVPGPFFLKPAQKPGLVITKNHYPHRQPLQHPESFRISRSVLPSLHHPHFQEEDNAGMGTFSPGFLALAASQAYVPGDFGPFSQTYSNLPKQD